MTDLLRPNLFIVGYPKTGMTSLFKMLAKHPNISPASNKESGDWQKLTNFNPDELGAYESYLGQFSHCPDAKYYLDGSTRYIINDESARTIKKFSPNAKIIIGLREPIAYLAALCWQIGRNEGVRRDFEEDLRSQSDYTTPNYFSSVNRYITEFGFDSVFVFALEELHHAKTVNAIFEFLELDLHTTEMPRENISFLGKSAAHEKIYNYLIYGALAGKLRNLIKAVLFKNMSALRQNFDSVFLKKANYKEQLIRKYPELAHETKLRFHGDVCQLSDLLSKDFNTLWGYTKHQ